MFESLRVRVRRQPDEEKIGDVHHQERGVREMLTFGNLGNKGTIPERRKEKG